jgi:predicted N-acetyltransferase YhbS
MVALTSFVYNETKSLVKLILAQSQIKKATIWKTGRKISARMFHANKLTEEDFPFAIALAETVEWGLVEQDFEFMTRLEPDGCFTLFSDSERIGFVTNVCFGKIGWLGNLIVNENFRNRGAGSFLVEHSIKYFKSKGVETVGLYAYVDKIPFYKKLGFEYDSDFVVLNGRTRPVEAQSSLKRVTNENVRDVISFDQSCFGASREKLLQPILLEKTNPSYVIEEKDEIVGYVIASVYEKTAELGPLMCRRGRNDATINLLETTLSFLEGLGCSACVSGKETAILDALSKCGLKKNFRVARMFLGPPVVGKCICMAESLERG